MHPTPQTLLAIFSLLGWAASARAHEPVRDMLDAANAFLAALTPEQKAKVSYPLIDTERENWNYVPRDRAGLWFQAMTPAQHELALALLRSGLSQRGYASAEAIIALENVLKEIEHGAARRNPEHYYVTIFAAPAVGASWGWRFEGHHLSLNFTIIEGQHVSVTPSFFGSNPAEVRRGPQTGTRILNAEEDLAHAFMNSLDDSQRRIAIVEVKVPADMITNNQRRAHPLAPAGLTVAQMAPAQREQLLILLKVYLTRYRSELAGEALAKIMAAGWEKVGLAWAGGLGKTDHHYYRIQGPTFLIEYDKTQDNANHIHTVWRDFEGDFGRDLLREHYAKDHAK
ncbi:MAG: DUF3500 domain-containing protein [Opitutaceae bacterium]|nr:DUF3500 domain-containing protein [Opitutaceae bacterium]